MWIGNPNKSHHKHRECNDNRLHLRSLCCFHWIQSRLETQDWWLISGSLHLSSDLDFIFISFFFHLFYFLDFSSFYWVLFAMDKFSFFPFLFCFHTWLGDIKFGFKFVHLSSFLLSLVCYALIYHLIYHFIEFGLIWTSFLSIFSFFLFVLFSEF